MLFRDDNVDVGPLRTALLQQFAGRVATVDDINRFVLVDTPYRESHWNRTPKAGGRQLDGQIWDQFPVAASSLA